jgi:N-acetylmuramoyl-L-alanine amidase
LRADELPVQAYQPVRDKVVRGRERWVPAVLRGNSVPTKVLVEILNLANSTDADLLASAAVRERLARALLAGLRRHFGETAQQPAAMTAAR